MKNPMDVVFYASLIAGVATLFMKLTTGIFSTTVVTLVVAVCACLQFAAFMFYEKFNGTVPPPTPPTA